MLLFRDWLRTSDADRAAYLQVKRDLAGRTWRHVQHFPGGGSSRRSCTWTAPAAPGGTCPPITRPGRPSTGTSLVERTFAWISKHRRTVRDYENLPASHEAMVLWAMTTLMTRRLAQTAELPDAH
jgi:hypothetical protein